MYCRQCGQQNLDEALFCSKCGADLKSSNVASNPTPSNQGYSSQGPGASSSGQRASFKITSAFTDAIALIRNPNGFMNANRDNDVSLQSLIINYVAILAVVPLVATLIGDSWYYSLFGFSAVGYAFAVAIVSYILDIVGVFVVGFVIWKLGPSFGTTTTQIRATRLAAYIFTPFFLLSIFNIVPFLGIIAVLGLLYGLYVLYLGMPVMLNTPKDRVITYLIVTVVVTFVIYFVIGAIVGAITTALFLASIGIHFF